jgi:phage repressor protein C with HTH and peptisase S24 domain
MQGDLHSRARYANRMNEPHDRLRAARIAAGYDSAPAAAEALGVKAPTYMGHENGSRGFASSVDQYARRFGTTPEWLLWGRGSPPKGAPKVFAGYPLVGKVGAGGLGVYADDFETEEHPTLIEPLPGMTVEKGIIVLETDGDSMAPMVLDGDLAFFGPIREDVESLLNKRVMARLNDGRRFFKILKRGSRPGVWTLRSLNPATPDIEDVEVTWVLPYRGSRPTGI